MIEKYFNIDPLCARKLLNDIKNMSALKRGIDRHAFLFDDYAVLSTSRLKLRNAEIRDDSLLLLDEIIETLLEMYHQGVSVVPILGYCYDPNSADGAGFLFQIRAKGTELYDDAIMTRYQVWSCHRLNDIYLHSNLNEADTIKYLLTRTHEISQIPQVHYDKFIADMIRILEKDILIDCNGTSNFFYDSEIGFQFIDLDSHNDYKYGLISQKPKIDETISICGFTPCHYAVGTALFAPSALDEYALGALTNHQRYTLAEDNCVVYDKCLTAMKNNGISKSIINQSLKRLKIYGL